MSALQRHTLCWLDSAELRLIARQMNGAFSALPASWREEARDYLLSGYLPGIVRRGIRDEVSISLGFCFPQRWQGQRLRLATVASLQAVTRVSTPEQTATLPAVSRTSATRAFNALRQAWRGPETGLGVWGSVALEMATPWLWTDSRSDLDIRITPWHEMALSDCYSFLTDIAQQYSVHIDGEINLPNGFSINIQEWFSGSLTLLAKGETDVELMTRHDVAGLIKHLSMKYIKGN